MICKDLRYVFTNLAFPFKSVSEMWKNTWLSIYNLRLILQSKSNEMYEYVFSPWMNDKKKKKKKKKISVWTLLYLYRKQKCCSNAECFIFFFVVDTIIMIIQTALKAVLGLEI